jgi:hypothetical protein
MSKEKRTSYRSVKPEERAKRVEKVETLRKNGVGLTAACEQAGFTNPKTFYNWKHALKGTRRAKTTKRKYTRRNTPQRIEITEQTSPNFVTVFRGSPAAVAEAMRVVG